MCGFVDLTSDKVKHITENFKCQYTNLLLVLIGSGPYCYGEAEISLRDALTPPNKNYFLCVAHSLARKLADPQ